MGKYIAETSNTAAPSELVKVAQSAGIPAVDAKHELIIMVVGETARADHFSLNGYQRNTNPKLADETNLISYTDITACGTSTAISVPCMFAMDGHDHFDVERDSYTENILDVLAKAGVNILWRDNNSDSKGVATRIKYEDFKLPEVNPECGVECRDTGMLHGLQDYVDSHEGDILIVLHQMGSHGPAYFKRYPPEFEVFTPVCRSNELSECSNEEIINAYDNTLLYTDYFLSRVIAFLKQNTPRYETAMMYVSDHGESLGEKGLYLHGMPYMFAPKEQLNVPVITWIGESSDIDLNKTTSLKDAPNSHDVVFPSLLIAFEIESDVHITDVTSPLFYMRDENDDL